MKEIDTMRRVKDLSDAERKALELTAVALRDAERVGIAVIQNWLTRKKSYLSDEKKIIRYA